MRETESIAGFDGLNAHWYKTLGRLDQERNLQPPVPAIQSELVGKSWGEKPVAISHILSIVDVVFLKEEPVFASVLTGALLPFSKR